MTTSRTLLANSILTAVLVLVVALCVNYLSRDKFVRTDLTQDREFALSPAARTILQGLDAPLRIEGKGVGAFEDGGGEIVLLVGEDIKIVKTLAEAHHEILAARFDRRILEQRIGVDALEALSLEGIAEGLGDGHPPLLVDLVDVPADQTRHFGPHKPTIPPTGIARIPSSGGNFPHESTTG